MLGDSGKNRRETARCLRPENYCKLDSQAAAYIILYRMSLAANVSLLYFFFSKNKRALIDILVIIEDRIKILLLGRHTLLYNRNIIIVIAIILHHVITRSVHFGTRQSLRFFKTMEIYYIHNYMKYHK